MRFLIELSGDSEQLALAEALAVCEIDGREISYDIDGRALLLDCESGPDAILKRLALAWSVSEHAFSCNPSELEAKLKELELPGGSFRVRAIRLGAEHSPQEGVSLARKAGKVLSARYKVDLKSPDAEIRILMAGRMHAGILCGQVDRHALESRKPENRPFNHPISLHPKLARALVNLTRVKTGERLLDPFCGTGGILIEAGLMGCDVLGGDIDARMVSGTKLNIERFGIMAHDIRQLDVSDWPDSSVDAIATDPPYGRSASTAKEPITSLYERAFDTFHDMLKPGGRLAIVLPSEEHLKLAHGLELEGVYPVRVHRSLTRFFCILKK